MSIRCKQSGDGITPIKVEFCEEILNYMCPTDGFVAMDLENCFSLDQFFIDWRSIASS